MSICVYGSHSRLANGARVTVADVEAAIAAAAHFGAPACHTLIKTLP